MNKWKELQDGGSDTWLWILELSSSTFLAVEVDDLPDEGKEYPRYAGQLVYVDIDWESRYEALRSCGQDEAGEYPAESLVEMMVGHGAKAPLKSLNSRYRGEDSWKPVGAALRAEGNRVARDPGLLEALLSTVVNPIGSSALEYGNGTDIRAIVKRSLVEGRPGIEVVAKMYGIQDPRRPRPIPVDPEKPVYKVRELTAEEHAALREYARLHGRGWKTDLSVAWARASEPGILQSLRNDRGFGPAGLLAYKLEA
jgi:hypothetical protein